MKTTISIGLLYVLGLTLSGCQNAGKSDPQELIQVDIEFSNYSNENGLKAAFIEYVHADGILLRENRLPIVGRGKVMEYLDPLNDENIRLTWEPVSGRIASSGDMGFTYGIYTLSLDTILQKGTYVSIWEKDSQGNWKYILDTGNQGIGE